MQDLAFGAKEAYEYFFDFTDSLYDVCILNVGFVGTLNSLYFGLGRKIFIRTYFQRRSTLR